MVEYLKTIGEEMGGSLQQLASGLQDIINPNAKYQTMLKDSLAKNPELISHLATIAKDNPGALESVFGKGSSGFFQGLHETPEAQLARDTTGATSRALKGNEEDVGRVKLGLPTKLDEQGKKLTQSGQVLDQAGQATKNERDKISLAKETAAAKYMASLPPEVQNDAHFKELTGMLQVDYSRVQERAHSMQEAQPWLDKSTMEIRKAYKKGLISDAALEGLVDLHPGGMQMMFKDMESDEQWAMRAAIARDAKTNRRLDIMSTLYTEAAKEAGKLGVKPGALFEAQYGYSPDEVVPNSKSKYTPEDVTAASAATQQAAKQAKAKAMLPLLGIYKEMMKPGGLTSGVTGMFNASADAAGIDLRVEKGEDNGILGTGILKSAKPVFMWNGQQIDAKTANSILSGETPGNTGIKPTEPTVSDKELSGVPPKAQTIFKVVKTKGYSWEVVKDSQAFKALNLTPAEQQAFMTAMGSK